MPANIFSNRIYYRVKPYLPWRLRMGVRRIIARKKRAAFKHVWPINEAAGHAPKNWHGWPDGKKFSLVLTHDVESSAGLAKCRQLMELEMKLGFRSSFNFIPEGEYKVPRGLRDELLQKGFEVGVHDLRHDGKLYWRRNGEFAKSARRINSYLQDWNAAGFRAAFMLHDRERLHHLDIEYDASTFDTDPFEPEPVGANTIFPFWISDGNGGGYVELPYTLPQDSTLFLVLDEKSPEIWKTKLNWLVARGGMVLLNVHPDYLGFGKNLQPFEYPAAWYEDFLRHVQTVFARDYWNPLPRNVARWFKDNYRPQKGGHPDSHAHEPRFAANSRHQEPSLQNINAAVVLYSYYASDPRPRREAEALKNAGAGVDVICLRKNKSEARRETISGVNVFRLPLKRRRSGKLVYMLQYAWFFIASTGVLMAWSFKKKYKLVHVHNMPDFLAFSGIIPRLRGAKVILDLHDPMPELFQSIYGLDEKHFIVRWLRRMEKISIAFADLVLTPNLAFKKLFTSRSCPPEKIQTVMNSPEATIFNPQNRNGVSLQSFNPATHKSFMLMYHGLIVERHGLDLAVDAVAKLREKIPGIQLHLFGDSTDYLEKMLAQARKLSVEDAICFHGFKTLNEIAHYIAQADLGIVPNRLSVFTQINFPTRIFEYLAMHKPVIVPATHGIRDYFSDGDMLFFEPDNADDLAAKILWAYENPLALTRLMEKGRNIYENNCWDLERQKFLGLVNELVNGPVAAEKRQTTFV